MNILRNSFFSAPAFVFIVEIEDLIIEFEISVAISMKPYLFTILCATAANIPYSRGRTNKVSRPGFEKCHTNAIYSFPLQWSVQI